MKRIISLIAIGLIVALFINCTGTPTHVVFQWIKICLDGFGDNNNTSSKIYIYDGILYAGTENNQTGAEVWKYSGSGTDWTQTNYDGFGDAHNSRINAMRKILVLGLCYIGLVNFVTGGQIWSSPDGENWTQVVGNGFADCWNVGIESINEFGNYIYVGTSNYDAGAQIWRTPDGLEWTQVVMDGFGNVENMMINHLEVFQNNLYAVTTNYTTGAEIWRTTDGITWGQVNISGFGDCNNQWIEGIIIYNDELYAGTNNVNCGQLWKSSDGTNWTSVNTDGFGDSNNTAIIPGIITQYEGTNCLLVGTENHASGGEVHMTSDGTNWSQVNDDGFGDVGNYSTGTFESTLPVYPRLIFHTTNDNGTEIWEGTPEEE